MIISLFASSALATRNVQLGWEQIASLVNGLLRYVIAHINQVLLQDLKVYATNIGISETLSNIHVLSQEQH